MTFVDCFGQFITETLSFHDTVVLLPTHIYEVQRTMSFEGEEEELIYQGGMSSWVEENMTTEEVWLLSKYRSFHSQQKSGVIAKFMHGNEVSASKLFREYNRVQSRISWLKDTKAKKAMQAARLKARRSEAKAKKQRDDAHIRKAISSLEMSDPKAGIALASLRLVVGETMPSPKRSFRYRVPAEWGFKQLRIVDPPTHEEAGFLTTLEKFSDYLTTQRFYNKWFSFFAVCKDWGDEHQHSVRMIDANRFEFMLEGKRGYASFLQLVMFFNESEMITPPVDEDKFRLDLIEFARTRMEQDVRTENLGIFKDSSLIVSCSGKQRAQNPHIDLLDPHTLQGGLIVTGGKKVQATYEYEALEPVVRDLQTFLSVYRDMPVGLLRVLQSTGESNSATAAAAVSKLLDQVGQLLSKKIVKISKQPVRTKKDSSLKTGAMLTLPGNVIHGGPKTEGVRAVLFLVASNSTSELYNSDVQFNTTNTWAALAQHVWIALGDHDATQESRLYLLERIKQSALSSCESSGTVEQVSLKEFVGKVEEAQRKSPGKELPAKKLKELQRIMVCLSCNYNAMEVG